MCDEVGARSMVSFGTFGTGLEIEIEIDIEIEIGERVV
jgi:hypothetical protein